MKQDDTFDLYEDDDWDKEISRVEYVLKGIDNGGEETQDITVQTGKKTVQTERKTVQTDRRTVQTDEKSVHTNRKTVQTGEKNVCTDSNRTQERRTGRSKKKRRGMRSHIFWVFLGVYTLALLFAARRFLKYTDDCLKLYESSQSEHTMEAVLADFEGAVADGSLGEKLDFSAESGAGTTFESKEDREEVYLSRISDTKVYGCEKDKTSYRTESPVYDITADGVTVAKVTLAGRNERTIFGILTILDWEVESIEPVLAEGRDYRIRVPSDCTVTVNGVTLDGSWLTGGKTAYAEFENITGYISMPELVEYQLTGLTAAPEISVLDAKGNEVEYQTDEEGNILVEICGIREEMPEDRKEEALAMAKVWENFLTRDLDGANYGFEKVAQYLIRDSYYYDMAYEYAHGVDITFISAHTLSADPYENTSVTDYVWYNENCYSCHIYFEKNMYLTRTGQTKTDIIDSTFYFVYYDDSDDGVDDPHWSIAEMIAGAGD